ncbi:MAG: N(4)-(beta-N-acetylglucosaminyl)-L-asparaginase [Bacteroidota bacterium]
MLSRRHFFGRTLFAGIGLAFLNQSCESESTTVAKDSFRKSEAGIDDVFQPTVLSTWNNVKANEAAWTKIAANQRALDAVEAGAKVPEADEKDQSVGYGGRPDREGRVTLDACIMDEFGNAGSVCYLQHIKHPISVARKVMEETPHIILAGDGALDFALANGFEKEELLTEKSKQEWQEWLKTAEYKPKVNIELHDTIGIIALDKEGNLSGACTTSGMAYKMAGRVGDSPIIGAGLFVDNEIGAAAATGHGEEVLKTLGSFLVVELMRQGRTPQQACEEAVKRIAKRHPNPEDIQIGYIALDKKGNVGAYSLQDGFVYALTQGGETEVLDAAAHL